ncbi:hypothetical protein [Streptomyces sp. NPDC053079]|uniref:hypothetical protein n=1 Tax=Streptomyces sp. NPDC053079 TaxID=3365697 RepID=UPI0037D45F92
MPENDVSTTAQAEPYESSDKPTLDHGATDRARETAVANPESSQRVTDVSPRHPD